MPQGDISICCPGNRRDTCSHSRVKCLPNGLDVTWPDFKLTFFPGSTSTGIPYPVSLAPILRDYHIEFLNQQILGSFYVYF